MLRDDFSDRYPRTYTNRSLSAKDLKHVLLLFFAFTLFMVIISRKTAFVKYRGEFSPMKSPAYSKDCTSYSVSIK